MKKLFLVILFLINLITNCFCFQSYELNEQERKKAYEKWSQHEDIMLIQKDAFMTNAGDEYFIKVYNHIASYDFNLTTRQIQGLSSNGVYFTPGLAECRIVEYSKKTRKVVRVEFKKPYTDYIIDDYWICTDYIYSIEEYEKRFI